MIIRIFVLSRFAILNTSDESSAGDSLTQSKSLNRDAQSNTDPAECKHLRGLTLLVNSSNQNVIGLGCCLLGKL